MIPADLLSALRDADPGLWERYKQWSAHMDIYDETALQYILQGELQEAIRARGWAYQVSCTFQGTRFAKIATINPDGSKWFHDDQHAPTEAEALLRAYLAAIQGAHV